MGFAVPVGEKRREWARRSLSLSFLLYFDPLNPTNEDCRAKKTSSERWSRDLSPFHRWSHEVHPIQLGEPLYEFCWRVSESWLASAGASGHQRGISEKGDPCVSSPASRVDDSQLSRSRPSKSERLRDGFSSCGHRIFHARGKKKAILCSLWKELRAGAQTKFPYHAIMSLVWRK
jgi:hypothetical protein